MHKDEVKGAVREVEGKAQKAWGDLTDSPADREIGAEKEVQGKGEQVVGKVKDALHKAID